MKIRAVVVVAALTALLVSCSTGREYESVADLVTALDDSGVACTDLTSIEPSGGSIEHGSCRRDGATYLQLDVYASAADRDAEVQAIVHGFEKLGSGYCVVFDDRWSVTSEGSASECTAIGDALGGTTRQDDGGGTSTDRGTPSPDLIKEWNYEDESPWDELHQLRTDQLTVVTDNPYPGYSRSARVQVNPGDTGWNGTKGTLRSEGRASIEETGSPEDGTEQWWSGAFYFPADFDWDEKNQFLYFIQWHQTANSGNPNMGLWSDVDEHVQLNVKGGSGGKKSGDAEYKETYDLGEIDRGAWNVFTVHIVWSPDPDEGLVEVWHDGALVHSEHDANLYEDQSVYVKAGIYSAAGTKHSQVIYLGPLRLGRTREAVELAG